MQIRTLLCVNEKYDANYHFMLYNFGKQINNTVNNLLQESMQKWCQ